ncbi:Type II secretory pathway component [Pseudomonas borbori]
MFKVLLFSLLFCGLAHAQGVDPTLPPANLLPAPDASGESEAPLVLQAILRSASGNRATIGGERLSVGDVHAGARIVAIYPHAVLIERQGQRELLRLAEPVMQPSR